MAKIDFKYPEWGKIKSGFRKGLAETRPYLLSHHGPGEENRCHTIRVSNQSIQLCARCSGIYPGIGGGLIIHIARLLLDYQLLLIAILPIFALVDWAVTSLTVVDGWNSIRTITGSLLGIAYGLGLSHFIVSQDLAIILIGSVYGGIAATLLAVLPRFTN